MIVAPNQTGLVIGGFAPSVQATPSTISNLFRSGLTSSVRGSINFDTRNDRLFPTKGVFASASAEWATPYIGSQSDYYRLSATGNFYYPIWGPFVFRTRLDFGYIGSSSSLGVPIYERYFLGGINTIRGFQLFSLGPKVNILQSRDPSDFLAPFNIGGNLQVIGNFEIEFPILPQVQIKGVVFFDAGNGYNTEAKWCNGVGHSNIPSVFDPCALYNASGNITASSFFGGAFGNLRTSVGFGFRWFSPIGPLRFEWGIPINKQPFEDPIVFEFTIGNFF